MNSKEEVLILADALKVTAAVLEIESRSTPFISTSAKSASATIAASPPVQGQLLYANVVLCAQPIAPVTLTQAQRKAEVRSDPARSAHKT